MSVNEGSAPAAAPADHAPDTTEPAKRPAANQTNKADPHERAERGRPGKRQRTGHASSTIEPPKSREEMTTEELNATLKRQVEYYLSDANLATDAFFHGKIEEAEKQGKGVSLPPSFTVKGCCPQPLKGYRKFHFMHAYPWS